VMTVTASESGVSLELDAARPLAKYAEKVSTPPTCGAKECE
jgi:hypothetical protein